MSSLTRALREPFGADKIKQRVGPGRKPLDYVPHGDYVARLLDVLTDGYEWTVREMRLVESSVEKPSFWLCHGNITFRLGDDGQYCSFDGIGTHPALDEESPKAAESDAFKRACMKAGVGLHLYTDDDETPQTAGAAPSPAVGVVHTGEGPCPVCHAPAGKPHSTRCTHRRG